MTISKAPNFIILGVEYVVKWTMEYHKVDVYPPPPTIVSR